MHIGVYIMSLPPQYKYIINFGAEYFIRTSAWSLLVVIPQAKAFVIILVTTGRAKYNKRNYIFIFKSSSLCFMSP